jgi:eukaryotic-like serine/threonine-protein kinase
VLRLGGDDPQRLGPYRLKAVIGDGGMGRVYLASSPAGRPVAVKVIGPGLANQPGYRERFAREARAAMAVSGLYTASVVDADTAGERPYIATEYVPAPSLAEAVSETGPLPSRTVFALAGGLAEALAAIHRAGLVHRDVKPHNILLAPDGPVVIDFGIAKGDESSLTTIGMTVGTPGYMAPEVLHGQDPSPRSDVFSLACVLVYAARGTGPFGTGDPLAIARRSASDEPDLTGVPTDVRALVGPMLQRDPGSRPSPAQLLQRVTLSSDAVLHDGLWLPDSVRGLLSKRKQDLQQALSGAGLAAEPDPTAAEAPAPPTVRPVAAARFPQYGAPHPARPEEQVPPSPRPTVSGTSPSDLNVLLAPPMAGGPGPARRSRKGFIALLGIGSAAVMAAAIVGVLLLANKNNDSGNTGSSRNTATVKVGGSTSAAATTSAQASDTSSPESTDSSDNSSASASAGSGDSVLNYTPGTYTVNQVAATDDFGDTVTLDSLTVDSDGDVTAKVTYTDEEAGEWTCAYETADEASLSIDSDATDASTGNSCTQDPSKTWYMTEGQQISSLMYFSQAPVGSGSWTFTIDTLEFQGSVSGISIPTS